MQHFSDFLAKKAILVNSPLHKTCQIHLAYIVCSVLLCFPCAPLSSKFIFTAGMAQWLSIRLPRRPPTNVAQVRFPDSASNVGRVCCWFSSLLREVFLRVLRFSPLLKNQHFQIPIQSGIRGPQICQYFQVLLSVTPVKIKSIFLNPFI